MTSARRAYVISDLHLGGSYGDTTIRTIANCASFSTSVRILTEWVDELTRLPTDDPQIESVINGDLVDFLAEGEGSPLAWQIFESNGSNAAASSGRSSRVIASFSRHWAAFSTVVIVSSYCWVITMWSWRCRPFDARSWRR